ncbi:hypothetical protein JHK87_012286 [Glycine soja]|nr:hypothetical protein JHK87_012286 [Glycine soja]
MDVLELDHPSLDNPFIPIDFDESQRYKSMIIYDIHRFLLNSKARNALLYALSEEQYTKVHSYTNEKQMCDTLALTYEGLSQYELFTMEEGEDIQTMFGRFQTILNELCCLNKTFDHYDNIDKILRMKNLNSMAIEELIGTLKLNRERKDKEKSSIICYECKNPGHFKLKCPNLDKSNDKKIYFKPKDKKLLMIIWEDLDDSSSN